MEFILGRLAVGPFIVTLFELTLYDESWFWISIGDFEYETKSRLINRSLFYFEYDRGRITMQFLFLNLRQKNK